MKNFPFHYCKNSLNAIFFIGIPINWQCCCNYYNKKWAENDKTFLEKNSFSDFLLLAWKFLLLNECYLYYANISFLLLLTFSLHYCLWCLSRKLWCIQINISLFTSVHLTTIFSLLDDIIIIISIFILFSLCEIAWKILMQITMIFFFIYLCRNSTNFLFVIYIGIISFNLFIIKMRVSFSIKKSVIFSFISFGTSMNLFKYFLFNLISVWDFCYYSFSFRGLRLHWILNYENEKAWKVNQKV